jgi:cytochrome c553
MNRLALAVVLLVVLGACGDTERPAPGSIAQESAADPAVGKSIAQRSCLACHRDDGKSAAPGIPRLASQNAAYLEASMREYADGKRAHAILPNMTPQLSDADMRNVAAYYSGLPPAINESRERAVPTSPYERGRAMSAACASCHGADGNSTIAGTPSLAGQQPQYLLTALAQYHRGARAPAVASMLRATGKAELESLALFYASQTPAPRSAPPLGNQVAGESLALSCTGCHGPRGVSNDAATPTLAGQDPQYLVEALAAYGQSRAHEAMERKLRELSVPQMHDIAAFYAVQKSKPAEHAKDFVSQLADKCNRCHGNAADATAIPVPRIEGQDKDYLVMALRAYRDDRRQSSPMHKMSLPFSEAAIDAIASLYANQSPRQ